jgi:alanyl-tRNA synthetase
MESLKPIEEVILAEEDKFLSLLNSAENRIPQLLAEKFNGVLDAEALFYLQSTSGFPPDVVALHYDEREIERLMPEFDTLMQSHKGKSGNFRKK